MMAYPSNDPTSISLWVCPECSYENEDCKRCMGPACNSMMPGGMFDTSQFAGIAMNQPAAATARWRGKGTASKTPPLLNKSLHSMRQRQMLLQVL